MQTVGLLRSVFINCGTVSTVPSKTQITPPPRANRIVGTARPTDATANNAIAALRNMIILLEELSLPTSTRIAAWQSLQRNATGFDITVAQLRARDARLNLNSENALRA